MKTSALFLVLCALAVAMSGCSDDPVICLVCPESETCSNALYDGRLYVSNTFGREGILIFDTATDELVDSIMYPTSGMCVDVSEDGKYLLATDAYATARLYDAATLTELGSIDLAGRAQFVNHDKYVMCHRLQTRFYSVPDLNLVHQDTIDFGFSEHYSPAHNSIYSVCDYQLLYEYSLDSFRVIREWQPANRDGVCYWMERFAVSTDDCRLYMIAVGPDGCVYFTYDLEADTLISEQIMYNYIGDVEVNPVGGEVYVTDPAVLSGFTPGTIFVFDGQTGEYLQGISLFGYLNDVGGAWDAMSALLLEITPDGSQLYVGTGNEARDPGIVFRVDTRLRRIEKFLLPEFGIWPYEMAIGPKP